MKFGFNTDRCRLIIVGEEFYEYDLVIFYDVRVSLRILIFVKLDS